ncbi:MAG: DMT family transporter [Paracoccus sp. (in: a-proteobacteria)]|nr:DMT family transporter [Paracoccus sp. (in: a-proteobacteria)]
MNTVTPHPRHPAEIVVALATGALLTVMLLSNSTVAAYSSPLYSSLVAHAVGTVTAVAALAVLRLPLRPRAGGVPFWAYLGGVSGAVTVMLTSLAANSSLALTGTLALGLAGQMVLALISDRFGILGMPKRMPARVELVSLAMISAGTLLIIFA